MQQANREAETGGHIVSYSPLASAIVSVRRLLMSTADNIARRSDVSASALARRSAARGGGRLLSIVLRRSVAVRMLVLP